jgi:hypothetical protein
MSVITPDYPRTFANSGDRCAQAHAPFRGLDVVTDMLHN